jgi:hypothetical protein
MSEIELAAITLEARNRGAFTHRHHFRTNAMRYVLFFTVVALAALAVARLQHWGAFGLLLGVITGVLARDRVYFRQHKETWPFYAKVIDWQKVQRIANGESA